MRILFTTILLTLTALAGQAALAQEDEAPVDLPAEVASDPSSFSVDEGGVSDTTTTLPDAGIDTTAPTEEPSPEPPPPSPVARPAKAKSVVHTGTKKRTAASTIRSKARADSIAHARAKNSTGASAFSIEMNPGTQYERIVTVEFGLKFYPKSYPSFQRVDTVAPAGVLIGFSLPVRVPFVTTTYRAKLSLNKIHKEYALDGRDKHYLQASNELLVGKALNIRAMPDLQYLPQAGVGFNNGISVGRDATDQIKGMHTHYFLSYTLSLAVRKRNILPKTKVPKKYNPMLGGMFRACACRSSWGIEAVSVWGRTSATH